MSGNRHLYIVVDRNGAELEDGVTRVPSGGPYDVLSETVSLENYYDEVAYSLQNVWTHRLKLDVDLEPVE